MISHGSKNTINVFDNFCLRKALAPGNEMMIGRKSRQSANDSGKERHRNSLEYSGSPNKSRIVMHETKTKQV